MNTPLQYFIVGLLGVAWGIIIGMIIFRVLSSIPKPESTSKRIRRLRKELNDLIDSL